MPTDVRARPFESFDFEFSARARSSEIVFQNVHHRGYDVEQEDGDGEVIRCHRCLVCVAVSWRVVLSLSLRHVERLTEEKSVIGQRVKSGTW